MSEIWRSIFGYNGHYEISNFGRVKSLKNYRNPSCLGVVIKPNFTKHGYYRINLTKNNVATKFLVHRLVAEAFIPNPNNLPYINHKDCDKLNNYVENLEWIDARGNTIHAFDNGRFSHVDFRENNRKTMKKVGQFSKNGVLLKKFECINDVEEDGFNNKAVRNCLNGWSNSSSGYIWKYFGSGNECFPKN